jgi:chromosome segregation ATPase
MSKEEKLRLIQEKIDRFANEIIKTWNDDKGWSLTLMGEEPLPGSYMDEQGQKIDKINALQKDISTHEEELEKVEDKFFKFGKGKLKQTISEKQAEKEGVHGELNELNEKQKAAREKFNAIKKALETMLTEYYFVVRGTDAEKDFETKFSFVRVYKPSYHELSTGKTKPEDRQKELDDQVAYIYDFRKMFEQYGADITKRETK